MSSRGTKNERKLREREGDPLTVILPPPESPHLESPVCLHICRWHELLRSYCVSESYCTSTVWLPRATST